MPASDPILFPADVAEREVAYSPSSCIDDIAPYLAAYARESERARSVSPPRTVRYGPGRRAELDVFDGTGPDAHVFIHGGYWQELSKSDASFPAPAFVERGVTYVAIGYDLAPQAMLAEIIEQARMATRWVRDHVCPDGVITVSGSSAGAHLAAWVSLAESVDRAVLLSGVYDLRPLVGTYVNEPLGLDEATAVALSPLLHLDAARTPVPTKILWGENETAAFKLQSRRYADALRTLAWPVEVAEIPGRNHFDLVHDLPRF